jgi:GWxTD domain-containing protein
MSIAVSGLAQRSQNGLQRRVENTTQQSSEELLCAAPTPLVCVPSDKACLAQQDKWDASVMNDDQNWLTDDVRWIISDEEGAAFKKLANDEEREQFIEQFWRRRDPTPETLRNEFREEHYRRMMYANEHFGSNVPGWKSDRGRAYVLYGPPDDLDSGTRTFSDGTEKRLNPFETWRYSKVPNPAGSVTLHFVDSCRCGQYSLADEDKNKLPPPSVTQSPSDRLEVFVIAEKPAVPRFKDLEEIAIHQVVFRKLPFSVASDAFRMTTWSDWTPITIRYRGDDLTWKTDGGLRRATVRVLGRVSTLKQLVRETFEDEVQLAESAGAVLQNESKTYSYRKALVLPAGRYRLDLVVKDVNGDRVGTWSGRLLIPDFSHRTHISPIILSKASTDAVFGIPVRLQVFAPADSVHLQAEVYGLGTGVKTSASDATIDYEVFNVSDRARASVFHVQDTSSDLKQGGEMLKIDRDLSPGRWLTGNYDLVLKVRDNVAHREFCSKATFRVQ